MTEPANTSLALATSLIVFLASQLNGMNAEALIGATAGASLFVMSAKDIGLFTRMIYLAIAISIGYTGHGVLNAYLSEHAVSAFVLSASTIGTGLRIIVLVETFDLAAVISSWLKK